jgi:AbrB family looped-hinge helix DNA binding protein
MSTTMTIKGQVTIPKHIRDSLGLKPGAQLDFAVNRDGEVVLQRTGTSPTSKADRFEAARGKADVKWRTHELMALLRGDD